MALVEIITFLLAGIAGYFFFHYLSHPSKKKHRLPKIGVWNIEFLPNFRLHIGSKTYHLHHWFILALIILIPFLLTEKFIYPTIFKGIIVGGILQGLTYSDRFKFRYPRFDKQLEELQKEFKQFTENVTSGKIFEPKKQDKKN